MAKLKGPLFSLGASQQLGKALVFFPWKGLNVVREYVVPSNPKTSGQTTQRGYLTSAVWLIHVAQAATPSPLDEEDIMAYALLASIRPTPRTWFNELVKQCVDQLKDALTCVVWRDGHLTPGANQLTFKIANLSRIGAVPTNGDIFWGTSKTALIHSQACTPAQIQGGQAIVGLTTGVKYYAQYRPDTPVALIGANSGIYYGVAA